MFKNSAMDALILHFSQHLDQSGLTIRLEYNDNPRTAGVAVKSIKVAGKTWRQKGEKGNQTETIKVNGVEKLRVVDASIMPSITSGNTNSPTLRIAEKASELILNEVQITRKLIYGI